MKCLLRLYALILFTLCVLGANCPSTPVPYYRQFVIDSIPSGGEMRIPKIIHQIWHAWDPAKANPPEQLKKWSEQLKKNHPDWKYILWDASTCEKLIRDHYPWFLDTYLNYDKPIKRHDSSRYFILHHMGGFYADMSSYNVKNLEPLLKGASVLAGEQGDNKVNMAILASVPKHPLFEQIIKTLSETKTKPVLFATGPDFFTGMLDKFLREHSLGDIRIVHEKFLYPYPPWHRDWPEPIQCRENPNSCAKLFPDAFMVKHFQGSWVNQ